MKFAEKCYAFRIKGDNGGETGWERKLAAKLRLRAAILDTRGGKLVIQGRADEKYISDEYCVEARDSNGNVWRAEYRPYPLFDFSEPDSDVVLKGYEHILSLPLESGSTYRFYLTDGKGWSKRIDFRTGKFSRLTDFEKAFFAADGHIIKRIDDTIRVYDYRLSTYLASMHRYDKALREKYGASAEVISVRRAAVRYRLTHRKPLWIMSDRSHLARDNAAALFGYLMKNGAGAKYDIRFLLEENSADFEKMKAIGRVLKFGTKKHHVMQAAASMVISSHADLWVLNPYGKELKYFRDLMDFRFAFIQHGIIMNDLSTWLHRYNKNISLFVTSTKPETESIASVRYGYDSSTVRMTGLARYDAREDLSEKTVIIAPTWRKEIGGTGEGGSRRTYREDFASSDYCRFFNSLINDERLLKAMKTNGYTGTFCVHPAHDAQAKDFKGNEIISVRYEENDYADMICRGAALITDYSSLAFDFAYLNKPVIYAQFDFDAFYDSQFYEPGYYSYTEDGFGPVCYDYESTVDRMIELIESNCTQPAMYADRVSKIFAYTDRSNCERIYKELERLQNGSAADSEPAEML